MRLMSFYSETASMHCRGVKKSCGAEKKKRGLSFLAKSIIYVTHLGGTSFCGLVPTKKRRFLPGQRTGWALIARIFCFVALFAGATAFATPKPDLSASLDEPSIERARAVAIFAGGCFWCMEPPFDKTEGVLQTVSGYIGGQVETPTYEQVSAGSTGHYEAVKVVYDPSIVSYEELLPIFWHNVDPLDNRGQFCDKGEQYLSAIFTRNQKQEEAAQNSLKQLHASGRFERKIATRILPAGTFYPAEEYHQDYYQKNPIRYRFYRSRCGRDDRLHELWNKGG